MPKRIDISNEEIKQLHEQNFNTYEIANILNTSHSTISRRLKKLNLKPHEKYRKYDINDLFFSEYNADSCYWAGFIAADGCIYKDTLRINLNNKDENHLVKFMKITNYKGNIHYRLETNSSYIVVSSKQIKNDLYKNFNITERKSLTLLPPKNINPLYIKDFIRGYIDGDGCYYIDKEGKSFSISIVGTFAILTWIKQQIQKNCAVGNPSVLKASENCFRIEFHGKRQDINIINWLFDNTNEYIYLQRKFEKSKLFLIERINKFEKPVIDLYLLGHSIANIGKKLNIGYIRISNILKRNNIKIEKHRKDFINKDLQEKIINSYKSGKTIRNITKIFNISKEKIFKILEQTNISKKSYKDRQLEKVDNKQILELHKIGYTQKQIGEIVGLSQTAIYKRLKNMELNK